jgi:tetratricopeptide (TPR) repeat protein
MADRLEHYKKALALFGEEQYLAAIEEYREALKEDPDWADGLHGLAMAQMNAGLLDEAIATGERLAEVNENDPFVFTSLSMFYQRKGLLEEAEKASAKARMLSWQDSMHQDPNAPKS